MLQIANLSVGYENKFVVKDINVSVNSPQLITIIGRNGQGKSTLLKTLSGLQTPLKGTILINEQNVNKLSIKEKSKLYSVVLTHPPAIQNVLVKDFVAFGRYPYMNWLAVKNNLDNQLVSHALKICGLTDFANRNITNLSDGERQKVALARAIAQDTPIIFLDEPTSHLDLVNQSELFEMLKKLVVESDKTIIISSHQLHLALHFSDEIWLINNKELIAKTPDDFKKSGEIQKLFGKANVSVF